MIEKNNVYTAYEVAKLLRVDKSVIYREIKKGSLKGKKLGRGIKFLGSQLLDFMKLAEEPEEK